MNWERPGDKEGRCYSIKAMHLRRIACLLLGAWLAGAIVVAWVATSNFTATDSVLAEAPQEIQKAAAGVGSGQAHMLLRYLVSVENANYFMTWELVEFGLLVALGAVLFSDRQTKWVSALPAALLLLVAFQHFRLTPEIIWLGQAMVLAGGSASARVREQFGLIHSLYGITEVVKLVLGIALAVWVISKRTVRRVRRSSIEALEPTAPDRDFAR